MNDGFDSFKAQLLAQVEAQRLESLNYVPPTVTQPRSTRDTFGRAVMEQTQVWKEEGTLIHRETAETIAAWWAADYPTLPYAVFATEGRITQDLIDALTQIDDSAWDREALKAYVLACHMKAGAVWTVGHNMPGYLPESDVSHYLSREEALVALRDEAEFGSEAIEHNEEEGREDHPDCDACANEGEIGAALTDPSDTGAVHISIDDGPRKVWYWATPNDRPVPVSDLINQSQV